MSRTLVILVTVLVLLTGSAELIAAEAHAEGGHAEALHSSEVNLLLAVMFLVGSMAAALMARKPLEMPSVVGYLLAGMGLVGVAHVFGWAGILELRNDAFVKGAAVVGVSLLMFRAGLEENVAHMKHAGAAGIRVALVGVIVPGVAGSGLTYLLLPGAEWSTILGVGATLVATSVGITAKTFKDLNYSGPERQRILNAAVIDDVLGLVALAIVTTVMDGQPVTVGLVVKTAGLAFGFLALAVVAGSLLAPVIGYALSSIHTGIEAKLGMAIAFCFLFGFAAAHIADMEPIIGAFAGGVVLKHVHFHRFDESHQVARCNRWIKMLHPDQGELRAQMERVVRDKQEEHVDHLIGSIARLFVPIFFVHVGMQVEPAVLLNPVAWLIALGATVVAVLGKLASGAVSGPVNKWLVGWAMVARGEVGLVFCNECYKGGAFGDLLFASMVLTVILTTLISPWKVARLIKKEQTKQQEAGSIPVSAEPAPNLT